MVPRNVVGYHAHMKVKDLAHRAARPALVLLAAALLGTGCSSAGNGLSVSGTTSGPVGVYGSAPVAGNIANRIVRDAGEFIDKAVNPDVEVARPDPAAIAEQIIHLPDHGPLTPLDRRALMRLQMGMTDPPEVRIERRRAAVRASWTAGRRR